MNERINREKLELLLLRISQAMTGKPDSFRLDGQVCGTGWKGYRVEDTTGHTPFGMTRRRMGEMYWFLLSVEEGFQYVMKAQETAKRLMHSDECSCASCSEGW